MTSASEERKPKTDCGNDICKDTKCEKNPCYYNAQNVEDMLRDIHDFMIIKKEQNGTRDNILREHRKELNLIHKDIKDLSSKMGTATVMGAITLAVLGAFLTVTTYLIIKSISG